MKKKLLLLLWLCIAAYPMFSQSTNPGIHLTTTTVPATCQGNGEIHCSVTYDEGLVLEQIRYYYIPLSGIDSIVGTTLPFVTHLRPGAYKVKVSALCYTGLPNDDAYVIVSDSIDNVMVSSTYTIPESHAIYNIYSRSYPFGIVPALTCEPTGKLQISMHNGTFPYSIEVWKITDNDTTHLRTLTFDTNEYTGNDPQRYDFLDYYTIDSLDVGTYQIRCHDGCGYYTPYLQASVPKVIYNESVNSHLLRNSSGIPTSTNIVTFKEIFNDIHYTQYNDDYYKTIGRSLYEYRFINPTLARDVNDTTPWRSIPAAEHSFYIHDTLSALHDYGELWGRDIQLQIRPICQDTLFSHNYTIYRQGRNYSNAKQQDVGVEAYEVYNYCEYNRYKPERDVVLQYIFLNHDSQENLFTADSIGTPAHNGYTLCGDLPTENIGIRYHNYITLPVRLKIVNITQDTLVEERELPEMSYDWSTYCVEGKDFNGDSLYFEVTDAHGNPLLTLVRKHKRYITHYAADTIHHVFKWLVYDLYEEPFCPNEPRHIGIYQENDRYIYPAEIDGELHYTYEKDTVQLVQSPLGNKYNFTAISDNHGVWSFFKENADNHATLEKRAFRPSIYKIYNGIELTDTNLARGRYVWIIRKPCPPNDTIIYDYDYDPLEMVEEPFYTLDTQCTALNIIPHRGRFEKMGVGVETFFQVYQGDTLTHTTSSGQLGDTLSIGVPGIYKVAMYAMPASEHHLEGNRPCIQIDTTIEWQNETVSLDYIYGHVCSDDDTIGFVRARGQHGKKPYTYTLYSARDGGGSVIAVNNTGRFDGVPVQMGQTVSVKIADACNAHFITNLTISDMGSLRKCWVEGNTNEVAAGIGDTCHFYGLALPDALYHWTGPAGFSSEERIVDVVMSGDQNAGMYYLEIEGSGCGTLFDSISVAIQEPPCPDAVDYDGFLYEAVRINGLCWTKENLRSTHYSDGRAIERQYIYTPSGRSIEETVATFGLLYDWRTAVDTEHLRLADATGHIQGICPSGWYIPDEEQFEHLGAWGAKALRSPDYWLPGLGGNNESGFTALPAGFYNGQRGRYENLLGETRFWSANPHLTSEITPSHMLQFSCPELINAEKGSDDAYSIRCILAE